MDISAAGLPYLRALEGVVAGIPAIILRIGFVGELGYEMHVPAEYGEDFWNILLEAGKEFGIAPFGVEAQRILRLEKGHIIVTQDTDALSTPIEAGLSWAVKLDKPDFIGRTSLDNLAHDELRQKLVGFEMDDAHVVPAEGAAVVRGTTHAGPPQSQRSAQQNSGGALDGYPVGRVTSARFSPTLGKAIGLAWVPATDAMLGAEIRIRATQPEGSTQGEVTATWPARIVPLPFYDPTGSRLKG
jgi:sarcosine oxidase subunit alpha